VRSAATSVDRRLARHGAALCPEYARANLQTTRKDRQRIKDLERELHIKDRTLAETAALLVLSKKVEAIFRRGEDESSASKIAVTMAHGIDTAHDAVAQLHPACEIAGIDERTLQRPCGRYAGRWQAPGGTTDTKPCPERV
jgi:formylmethanofuran dehydrogenase subunit B